MADTDEWGHPLVLVSDGEGLDDVLELAAMAGSDVQVVADVADLRPRWSSAPAVIIGAGVLDECVRAGLPRRARLLVVAKATLSDTAWHQALRLGADKVLILPVGRADFIAWLRTALEPDRARGQVVCCVGGSGGAGASVLAAALALAAAPRALLVDLDPYGGGLDLALGAEAVDGARWPQLDGAGAGLSAGSLRTALPTVEGVPVLAAGRDGSKALPPDAVSAVLAAGCRGCDWVIVDLPRALTPAAAAALAAADRVLLVVPAEVRACVAAAALARALAAWTERTEVVVRSRSTASLSAAAVAKALDLPLAGQLRTESSVAAALDRGEVPTRRGRGSLAGLCRQLLASPQPATPSRVAA